MVKFLNLLYILLERICPESFVPQVGKIPKPEPLTNIPLIINQSERNLPRRYNIRYFISVERRALETYDFQNGVYSTI